MSQGAMAANSLVLTSFPKSNQTGAGSGTTDGIILLEAGAGNILLEPPGTDNLLLESS